MSYVLVDGSNRKKETYLRDDWKDDLDNPYCSEISRALHFDSFEDVMKQKSPREKVLSLKSD